MNFTSLEFLVFFPVVLFLYWRLPGRFRWALMLGASYFFYMNWNPALGFLLAGTTLVSYGAAVRIQAARKRNASGKGWLVLAAAVSLGSLAVFKYGGFLAESTAALIRFFGGPSYAPGLSLILPAGISFYTFQTLSYVLDVYRGRFVCERHLGYYALYVSFFPQLVAGPIERPGNLLPQLHSPAPFQAQMLYSGGVRILRGFFKKLVIADYLGAFVDRVYSAPEQADGLAVILATAFFAVQIYCDFSGYTDIARGTAETFGIRLMENFRRPYRAASLREFWRRWHISLTGWFKDYVYIPLGGSRHGLMRTCRNVLIVFSLSGLWHGAAWNFVAWGLIHGICLTMGILWEARVHTCWTPYWFRRLRTLLLAGGAWVFFRAQSVGEALTLFGRLGTGWSGQGILDSFAGLGLERLDALLLPLVFLGFWTVERRELPESFPQESGRAVRTAFTLCTVIWTIALFWLMELETGAGNVFLYFQF